MSTTHCMIRCRGSEQWIIHLQATPVQSDELPRRPCHDGDETNDPVTGGPHSQAAGSECLCKDVVRVRGRRWEENFVWVLELQEGKFLTSTTLASNHFKIQKRSKYFPVGFILF